VPAVTGELHDPTPINFGAPEGAAMVPRGTDKWGRFLGTAELAATSADAKVFAADRTLVWPRWDALRPLAAERWQVHQFHRGDRRRGASPRLVLIGEVWSARQDQGQLRSGHVLASESVEVHCELRGSRTITNTGNHGGTDVVQLYAADTATGVTIPAPQLIGLVRFDLEPGRPSGSSCRAERRNR
jgi:hypothetical protein